MQDERDRERFLFLGPHEPVDRVAIARKLLLAAVAELRGTFDDELGPLVLDDDALDGVRRGDRRDPRVLGKPLQQLRPLIEEELFLPAAGIDTREDRPELTRLAPECTVDVDKALHRANATTISC